MKQMSHRERILSQYSASASRQAGNGFLGCTGNNGTADEAFWGK